MENFNDSKALAIEIAKILDKKKAHDVRVLKVESLTVLTDYFVIASGTSTTYTGPIDVSEMNLVTDEWPHGSASTDANVQYMGRIDKESDDAILNGDTDLDGAVTTDGQAAGSAN